ELDHGLEELGTAERRRQGCLALLLAAALEKQGQDESPLKLAKPAVRNIAPEASLLQPNATQNASFPESLGLLFCLAQNLEVGEVGSLCSERRVVEGRGLGLGITLAHLAE